MNSIEDLKKQIVAANEAYRNGHPTMSDQEYDDLLEQCKKTTSPEEFEAFACSLNEGAIEYGKKVKHPYLMGSLSKLKYEEPDKVKKFIKDNCARLHVSAKVDGISCRLHYERGFLVSATTRGDGYEGIDLTDKIRYVKHIPNNLFATGSIDVRGELIILKKDFSKLSGFANARNAVAGIMNRKDWKKSDVSCVSFIAYTILGKMFTKVMQFKKLNELKFKTAWNTIVENPNDDKDIIKKLFDYASQDFEYDTDGLVLSSVDYINEDAYKPEKQKAFKINQLVAETKLVDVSWEGPSKDGFFTGVGILEPVEIGGSCISRVTLHNLDIIEQLGLMYGSKVQITKAGDVIPHLDRVVENDLHCSKIELPHECPCCGSKLVRDGINMRCINKNCPDQVIYRLTHFIKKLGVKSASNATLENFGITSFKKLVDFVPDKKYKSQVKLYDELYAKVFSQSKEKLLGAMNFVGLSETLIDKIVSHYGYSLVESSSFKDEAYKSLPNGIGTITLDKFIEDLPEALSYVDMVIKDTRWHFTKDDLDASRSKIRIKGSICVTGSLKFGSRNKFLDFALAHGYESKAGISKGLTYLINNDINSNSSKNRKAKEFGIKILSEDAFMKLIVDDSVESSIDDL